MELTFRTNSDPSGDAPNWNTYPARIQRVERARGKSSDKQEYTALIFLPPNTEVDENDQVEFRGRWYSFKEFEPIRRFGAENAAHFEVMI